MKSKELYQEKINEEMETLDERYQTMTPFEMIAEINDSLRELRDNLVALNRKLNG